MPLPGPVRKEILTALDQAIIPDLHNRATALGNMAAPHRLPPEIVARLVNKTVPRLTIDDMGYPIHKNWPKANLDSTFSSTLCLLYEGRFDEHTFINPAQAKKWCMEKGIYAVRMQAPCILFYPPGTPHNSSEGTFWNEPQTPVPVRKILWLDYIGNDIYVHTHHYNGVQTAISHALQIDDTVLASLGRTFVEVLHASSDNAPDIARAILLAMMLQLRWNVAQKFPPLANTAYPPIASALASSSPGTVQDIWRNTVIYIQMHLHDRLTLPLLSRQSGLSPTHLNRVFQQYSDVSVMRYVRLQRIAAAKKMLIAQPENINEIALMVGFQNAAVFATAFRRETAMTPNEYRRRSRNAESIVQPVLDSDG